MGQITNQLKHPPPFPLLPTSRQLFLAPKSHIHSILRIAHNECWLTFQASTHNGPIRDIFCQDVTVEHHDKPKATDCRLTRDGSPG